MISPLMIRTSPGWLPLSVLVGKFYMVYLSLHLLIYIHDFDDGGRKQTMMHLVFDCLAYSVMVEFVTKVRLLTVHTVGNLTDFYNSFKL